MSAGESNSNPTRSTGKYRTIEPEPVLTPAPVKDGCLTSGGRQLSEGYFISFDSPLGGEIRKPSAREKGSN